MATMLTLTEGFLELRSKTYVAHDVASGHEAAGVAGEKDGQSVELVGLAEAVHGCHVGPLEEGGVSNFVRGTVEGKGKEAYSEGRVQSRACT